MCAGGMKNGKIYITERPVLWKGQHGGLENAEGQKGHHRGWRRLHEALWLLDKAIAYLKEAGIETQLFENVEPDPSVETVMRGAEAMRKFQPDWIISMGGGSPIDAAKAMWAFLRVSGYHV